MSSKKKKLLDIIMQIQDLYPHLDRLLVSDVNHPDQIVITSAANIEDIAEEEGFDIEMIDTFFEEDIEIEEMLGISDTEDFGDDNGDDNGGGVLQ